ncbi:MAG: hypothetical protein AB7O97_10415 [Planctomycetota bacterium]
MKPPGASRIVETMLGAPSPFLLLACVSLAVPVACSGGPAPAGHPRFDAETVTVTVAGLLPGADVHVGHFGTVVFRNELPDADVEVELQRPFAPSDQCSTTVQFSGHGDTSRSRAIPPRGLASICFHEQGQFAFVVRTPQGERRGRVLVGGAR